MKKICIIGNNANGNPVTDGGRIKIRLFVELLSKVSKVSILDLCNWKKKIFSIIREIKRAVNENDVILIMAGPNGCRQIIPLVNFFNQKMKKRVVFCGLGIGTLDKLVCKKSIEFTTSFLNGDITLKDNFMKKQLKKIDCILVENQTLLNCYKKTYAINNVFVLPNFRNTKIKKRQYEQNDVFKIIFLSRVTENKGILDLVQCVKDLLLDKFSVKLDIYGELQLSKNNVVKFNSYLCDEIAYHGQVSPNESLEKIKQADLFCLPTKYNGEGMPGAVVESLIVGTPVLLSNYSQAKNIIQDGCNGILCNLNDINDLKNKLIYCYNNYELLKKISFQSQEYSKQFVFSTYENTFYNYILGDK